MAEQLHINVQDIALANVGFEVLQVIIDMLIKKKILDMAQIHDLFKQVEKQHKLATNPLRRNINDAASELGTALAAKYAWPSKKH